MIVEASPIGKRSYELGGFESKEDVHIPRMRSESEPDQQYFWMEREPKT
jgi:hypothetical protein